jgi:hypothetical protein
MPGEPAPSKAPAPLTSELDLLLTAQIAVAWAGEGHVGEEPRLGWWRSDLTSEFGGRDLFERLLPRTHCWAVLLAEGLKDREVKTVADIDSVLSQLRDA